MTRTWSGCGCVEDVLARPYRKMRLSVAWAALYSGLVEYMRNVAMWVLCVNCGMDCGLPVARRHLTENWSP